MGKRATPMAHALEVMGVPVPKAKAKGKAKAKPKAAPAGPPDFPVTWENHGKVMEHFGLSEKEASEVLLSICGPSEEGKAFWTKFKAMSADRTDPVEPPAKSAKLTMQAVPMPKAKAAAEAPSVPKAVVPSVPKAVAPSMPKAEAPEPPRAGALRTPVAEPKAEPTQRRVIFTNSEAIVPPASVLSPLAAPTEAADPLGGCDAELEALLDAEIAMDVAQEAQAEAEEVEDIQTSLEQEGEEEEPAVDDTVVSPAAVHGSFGERRSLIDAMETQILDEAIIYLFLGLGVGVCWDVFLKNPQCLKPFDLVHIYTLGGPGRADDAAQCQERCCTCC